MPAFTLDDIIDLIQGSEYVVLDHEGTVIDDPNTLYDLGTFAVDYIKADTYDTGEPVVVIGVGTEGLL